MITDPIHLTAAAVLFGVALLLGYWHGYDTGYRRGQSDTEQEAARELPRLLARYGVDTSRPMGAETDRAA